MEGDLSAFYVKSAPDHPLVQFARFCFDVRGIIGSSIANYVSTVRTALNRHFTAPVPPSQYTTDLLTFYKSQPRERRMRDPASPQLVSEVLRDDDISLGVRAAVATMWFCTLRSGSILSHRQTTFDPDYCLLREDVFVHEDKVALHVRSMKADKLNAGDIFWVCPTGGAACPVRLLRRYLSATAHLPADAPFFRHLDGRLVSRGDVTVALRSHAERLGIPSEFLSSHSLRVGSATAMATHGLSLADIMLQGRWASSDSALMYLRMTLPRAERFIQALSLEDYYVQSSGLPRFQLPTYCLPRAGRLRGFTL